MSKKNHSLAILFTIMVLLLLGTIGFTAKAQTRHPEPVARQWMQYSMYIIKNEVRTPPTTTARFYAYVASAYQETVAKTHSQAQASAVAANVINQIFPTYTERTNNFLKTVDPKQISVSPTATEVLQKYTNRLKNDGFNLAWDRVIPVGEDKWHKQIYPPSTPRAGDWKTWIIDSVSTIPVKAPPVYGGAEDLAEVADVITATKNRTAKDEADIRYWNAGPGTEGPSGLWLNRLYDEVGTTKSDEDYAYMQKVLAQSLADSFIVTWHIKYTYWTQRPSMRTSEVSLSFHDPPFPSYISGHSTISSTAATVLSRLVPQKTERWHNDAATAAHSRLVAGLHFDNDNVQGIVVGRTVGEQIVSKL